MQLKRTTSLLAGLAAIGLNLTPGLAQAEYAQAMTGPPSLTSRVLAAEINAFRDGAASVRELPEAISDRVNETYHRSGAWARNLSAHQDRIEAARSEGVVTALTAPTGEVAERLDGMLVGFEVIDATIRLDQDTNPRHITPQDATILSAYNPHLETDLGLPAGSAALAGYERMMSAWADLGPLPEPTPIWSPEREARVRELVRENPAFARFVPADLMRSSPAERAERIRELAAANPGLERFVHPSILEGSDLATQQARTSSPALSAEQRQRLADLIERHPRAARFFPKDILAPEEPTP